MDILTAYIASVILLQNHNRIFSLSLFSNFYSLSQLLIFFKFFCFLLPQEFSQYRTFNPLPSSFHFLDKANHDINIQFLNRFFFNNFFFGSICIMKFKQEFVYYLVAFIQSPEILLSFEVSRYRYFKTLWCQLKIHNKLIKINKITLKAITVCIRLHKSLNKSLIDTLFDSHILTIVFSSISLSSFLFYGCTV